MVKIRIRNKSNTKKGLTQQYMCTENLLKAEKIEAEIQN